MARRDFFDQSDAVASDRADYLRIARSDREGEILRWSNFHRNFLAFGIASYRKPATLLAALRGVLGEETFNEAFRAFFETWAYKHPYPSDFFNTFERVSDRELDWFWYSWYDTTWTLDQAVDRVERQGSEVAITVADEGKVPMPVHLTLTLANDETVTHEIPVDVWLAGRTATTTTVPVNDARVERVEIDADHHFPDVNRQNNVWTASN
jgi:aminopeptidase N